MSERERLEQAIAALESQRPHLGDDVVDAAQATLRQKMDDLDGLKPATPEPGLPQQSERRILTVLFCDVVGSTAMAEQMDPEAWTEIMNAAFGRLLEPVYRYGGTVARLLGDALLAFFGAPTAHEDDPERACRAALQVLEEARAYAEYLEREVGVAGFKVRVGINTGLVVVGQVGSDLREEYTAMGDAVNVAARLESAADPGTVLIGEDTYRLVSHVAQVEPLGPIHMKGKAQPLPVYRLLTLQARSKSRFEPGPELLRSPLVGRDRELNTLAECLEHLSSGQGGLVTIIGGAGLGKSRLIVEARQRQLAAGRAPVTWFVGQALSYGQSISYWPFHEILQQFAGIKEEDSEAEAWRKLKAQVRDLFTDQTPEILPYLATLLSLEVEDAYAERVKYLDGEAMRQQIFLVSRRLFERLARKGPLVLVFEDLHWADEPTAQLLEHLLPLVERVPILICASSRPDPSTPATHLRQINQAFPGHHAELRLQPLSAEKSRQMLLNLVQFEGLSPGAEQAIADKAEGNPFFLEEIMRSLVDGGSITRDELTGTWRVTEQIESVAMPDTIQGVIVARLDRLPEDAKALLRTASVIGRDFPHRLLSAVVENDLHLDRHLKTLQRTGFIQIRQRSSELEYSFRHALVQEAVYESILLKKRREVHGQVGRAIERLFSHRLEEFYGLLAYHYARAEMWEKSQEYLLMAGDQAVALAADAAALFYYRQALQTYARYGNEDWGTLQRATLERKMAIALTYRGETDGAVRALQRALEYISDPLPASTWGIRLATVQEALRQITHRLLPRLFIAPSYRPASPMFKEELRIYEGLTWIDIVSNPEQMLLVTLRVLNRSERQGAAWGVAASSMALAFAMTLIPLRRLPEGYYRRALAIAKAEGMQDVQGLVNHARAWIEAFQGHWPEALAHSRRAAEITQVTGQLLSWAFPRYQIATILTYQGLYQEAILYCQQLIEFGREGDANQVLCWGLAALGFVRRHQGRLDEALVASEEAADLAQSVPDHGFAISARAEVGRSFLRQGHLDQALRALETSLQSYQDYLGPDSYASLRNGLAEAHLAAAEANHQGNGREWLKKAGRSCRDALKLGRKFVPATPEAMRLRGTYEWLRGKRPAAQKWWVRSLDKAEELGQPYDSARTHVEIGQRLFRQDNVEQAGQILSKLGVEHNLVRQ